MHRLSINEEEIRIQPLSARNSKRSKLHGVDNPFLANAEKIISASGSSHGDRGSTQCATSNNASDSLQVTRPYNSATGRYSSVHNYQINKDELLNAITGPISKEDTRAMNLVRERRHVEQDQFDRDFTEMTTLDHAVDINVRVADRKVNRSISRHAEEIDRNRAILDVFPSWKN